MALFASCCYGCADYLCIHCVAGKVVVLKLVVMTSVSCCCSLLHDSCFMTLGVWRLPFSSRLVLLCCFRASLLRISLFFSFMSS